jgi:uncharacterized membrane protein
MLLKFFILAIFVEAITNLLRNGSILEKFRNLIFKINFIKKMFDCGFCTSFHVTYLSIIFYFFVPKFLYFVSLIVIWRLSNLFHNIVDLVYNKKFKLLGELP